MRYDYLLLTKTSNILQDLLYMQQPKKMKKGKILLEDCAKIEERKII